jgi:ElaA protein
MILVSKSFNELTIHELHDLLQLRSLVFVVEQDCVYQDIDGKDDKATHVLGMHENRVVAYARIFAPGDFVAHSSIGRVVVHPEMRSRKLGKELMNYCIHFCKSQKWTHIAISAQCYLDRFYTELGFVHTGKEYLEDGIPHQEMIYTFIE